MKAKHTPGPWIHPTWPCNVTCGEHSQDRIYSAFVFLGGTSGHDAIAAAYGDSPEQASANARLIAAAPDLLAALLKVVNWFEDLGPPLGETQSSHAERMLRAEVRAALAAVEG